MNVLKEGKTYYLSSMNSSYPLIPCDEALQYLKLPLQNDTLTLSGNGIPAELMAYTPSNGYYTLPLSMIPIHTQSVLYPTMQYFPPLSSILPSSGPSTPFETPLNLEPVEGDSDSSDEESDYSSSTPPTTSASAIQNINIPDQSPEFGASLLYELSLPYQCYPVYTPGSFDSNIVSQPATIPLSAASIPMVLASLPEVALQAAHQVVNQAVTIASDTSSVLLKRSRDEFETDNQEQSQPQNQSDGVFTMVPTNLPTLTNTLA